MFIVNTFLSQEQYFPIILENLREHPEEQNIEQDLRATGQQKIWTVLARVVTETTGFWFILAFHYRSTILHTNGGTGGLLSV